MLKETRRATALTVLLSVLATLLALAPVGYAAYRNLPARVATIDLKLLLEEEQKRTAELLRNAIDNKTRLAMEYQSAEFAAKLTASIDELGQRCNCAILNKAALLGGGALDYTDEVRSRLSKSRLIAQALTTQATTTKP